MVKATKIFVLLLFAPYLLAVHAPYCAFWGVVDEVKDLWRRV